MHARLQATYSPQLPLAARCYSRRDGSISRAAPRRRPGPRPSTPPCPLPPHAPRIPPRIPPTARPTRPRSAPASTCASAPLVRHLPAPPATRLACDLARNCCRPMSRSRSERSSAMSACGTQASTSHVTTTSPCRLRSAGRRRYTDLNTRQPRRQEWSWRGSATASHRLGAKAGRELEKPTYPLQRPTRSHPPRASSGTGRDDGSGAG
eukprot:scaffold2871_cov106-Isochrysis_galbana.AAC.6